MHLGSFSILFCATLFFSSHGIAQDENNDDFEVLFSFYPADGVCTQENTSEVNLRTLIENADDYREDCVSTSGYFDHRALFYRRADIDREYPGSNEEAADRRLGVYGSDELMQQLYELEGRKLRLTGLISDCDRLADPNTMIMGYCHYTSGPVIGVSLFEVLDQ